MIDQNQNSPTFGQVKDVIIISEGENYPVAEYTTGKGGVQELFISKVIVDNPGINYQPSDVIADDNLKLILKEDGSIAGVDVVKQMPTDILPTINISTNTGSGAVLRPVMSIERSTREERLIQVIDCILPKENYQILETETSIEPEISAETLVETPVETPVDTPVGTPVETASATTTTPMQTNVSNTTTTSQSGTSSIPQTDPVDTSSQQETGQSNTPPPSSPPSGGGSSGSSGGYGY